MSWLQNYSAETTAEMTAKITGKFQYCIPHPELIDKNASKISAEGNFLVKEIVPLQNFCSA